MKKKALKAGDRVLIISDEKGVFLATIKEIDYDLDEDGKKQPEKLTASMILEERFDK